MPLGPGHGATAEERGHQYNVERLPGPLWGEPEPGYRLLDEDERQPVLVQRYRAKGTGFWPSQLKAGRQRGSPGLWRAVRGHVFHKNELRLRQ